MHFEVHEIAEDGVVMAHLSRITHHAASHVRNIAPHSTQPIFFSYKSTGCKWIVCLGDLLRFAEGRKSERL